MSAAVCSACGGATPPGARFCPACGASLGGPQAGERRVVTVVFADLAGFTTMAEGRDPEAVKDLLDTCFGALVPVIDEHGGTVDKIIGDELMAVFGAPRAHEDDPERAVRAALALIAALERLDPSLEMRVGINTGEVLAGPVGPGGAYTVTGDTVNTAHRLVGVAGTGSVLVGERTHALTREAITYGASASHTLRGRREPVIAYPALRVRHRPGQRIEVGSRAPMLGRDAELSQLVSAIEDAGATATPRLVSVLGEAGLGKTRLIDELQPTLRRLGVDARVVTVACAPYGSEGPLAPLAAVVRGVLDVDPEASLAEQRAAVARTIEERIPDAEVDRQYLTHRTLQLLGLSGLPDALPVASPTRGRRSDELTGAARVIVEATARDRTLVIVLDDVHFADPAVVELAERIASTSARRTLVAVAVGREELLDQHPGLTASVGPRHLVLRLAPLDDTASGELLHRTLVEIDHHSGTLAAAAEEQILRAAGGNPLLLDQLVRYLRERDALVVVEGGWRVTRDLAEAGLPDDARALLGARLDGLPPDERAVLQGAAIAGRTFTASAVAAMQVPVEPELLDSLVGRGLLLRPQAGDGDVDVFAFRHAMVRDAAYASVPIGGRASKHALLAQWLEAADREERADEDGHLARVAHHVERAVSLAHELGQTSLDVAGLSTGAVVAAARAARQRDELSEAERWYQRARELDLIEDADRVAVTLEHGTTLLSLRRLPEAKAVLTEVLDHTPAGSPAAAEAYTGLGVVARLLGDAEGALAHFETGRRAWQANGDLAGEAGSVRTHGWAELVAGRPRSALPKLLRARELDEVTGRPRGITLQCLAWCEFLLGDHAAARANLWEAARELSGQGDRLGLGWCFGILGNSLRQEGRIGQAQNVADNLLNLSRGLGDPWGEGMCLVLQAGCHLEAGDPDAARTTVNAALRIFAELDDPWGDASARLVQGMIERVAGDLAGAQAALERGLQTAQQVASFGAEAQLRAELAATLLDSGDEAGGAREARATLALVRSGGGDRDSEIRALVVLAKRARDGDDDPDARLLLEEAIALAAGDVHTSIWRRAVAWSAILAAEAGDAQRAHELAAGALDGSWESARTWVLAQRAVAAAHRASGNPANAVATLGAVLGRFRDRPLAFLDVVRSDLRDLEVG